MADLKTCKYCGCSFKSGSGVNSKGKKYTIAGWIWIICTFGFGAGIWPFNFQKYCSRQCQQNDRGQIKLFYL